MTIHAIETEDEAWNCHPEIGDTIRLWDHQFEWTEHHRSPQQLAPLRHQSDTLADRAFLELNLLPKQDAFTSLERAILDPRNTACIELWNEANHVPEFVDWDQIERGQDVFYKYAGAALTGLLNDSLIGGFGSRRISEVLVRTGSFGVSSARRRLMQTTQWILDCTRSPTAIQPGGQGWKGSLRVRLLHAHVRSRILGLVARDPSYFNVPENGIPINLLHSIATITSFSSTIIDHSLPRMMIHPTPRERIDYIALWRYLATLLGVSSSYFKSPEIAGAWLTSIILAELHPVQKEGTPTRILLGNAIDSLAWTKPSEMSPDYIAAQIHFLLGPKYASAIGVPPVSLFARFVTWNKVVFLMLVTRFGAWIPGWERVRIERLKIGLYRMIVESKEIGIGGPSLFEMEWVPQLANITRRPCLSPTTTTTTTKTTSDERGNEKQGNGHVKGRARRARIGKEVHYLGAMGVLLSIGVGATYFTIKGIHSLFSRLDLLYASA